MELVKKRFSEVQSGEGVKHRLFDAKPCSVSTTLWSVLHFVTILCRVILTYGNNGMLGLIYLCLTPTALAGTKEQT